MALNQVTSGLDEMVAGMFDAAGLFKRRTPAMARHFGEFAARVAHAGLVVSDERPGSSNALIVSMRAAGLTNYERPLETELAKAYEQGAVDGTLRSFTGGLSNE